MTPQRFRDERGAKSWLSVRSEPQQIPWVERTQFGTERRQSSFTYLVRFDSLPARCLTKGKISAIFGENPLV